MLAKLFTVLLVSTFLLGARAPNTVKTSTAVLKCSDSASTVVQSSQVDKLSVNVDSVRENL